MVRLEVTIINPPSPRMRGFYSRLVRLEVISLLQEKYLESTFLFQIGSIRRDGMLDRSLEHHGFYSRLVRLEGMREKFIMN